MLAAFLLFVSGTIFTSPTTRAPWDRVGLLASGPMIVAIDSDSDLPSKEYGLLRPASEGDNEEEDGDGDGDEIKPFGMNCAPYLFISVSHSRLAASARQGTARAVASEAGISFLRC